MGKKGRSGKLVRTIGAFKLLKGLLLIAIGCGAMTLIHGDTKQEVTHWIERLNMDPNNHFFGEVAHKLLNVNPKKALVLSIGTFFYAALFLTEGVGLLLLKRWAEYFAVIITASFLPLEIYELIKKFSAPKVIAIVLNAAIVIYLIMNLRKEKSSGHQRQKPAKVK